jgi:cysteine synthase
MMVVEATAGSTGSSLAFEFAVKNYKFQAVSSNAFAVEELRTMQAFDSTLDKIENPSGIITTDLIPLIRSRAKGIAKDGSHYYCDQFSNRGALIGYESMGRELI